MKQIQYPDSDQALTTAIEHGKAELNTVIKVDRPWQSNPSELQVRYAMDFSVPGRAVAELNGLQVPLDSPLELIPAQVAKPWGEEIWFSGIEARGESRVRVAGGSLPLLDYLSLAPARLCGAQPVILLKMLDSRAEPITGELYFEIHEQKTEVYVVADVNRSLYPDGIGSVRFGMNQDKRGQFSDDEAFREAFLDAVRRFESNSQATPPTDNNFRQDMLSFVATEALRPGDSLIVPPGVPHSLQPGLQVIEFQTPVFERRIIYASQPVVTQSGWDSASAIADMSLDTPQGPRAGDDPDPLLAGLAEFSVSRLQLSDSQPQPLTRHGAYALCIALYGPVQIDCASSSLILQPGSAAFIPGSVGHTRCCADQAAQLLIATPRR